MKRSLLILASLLALSGCQFFSEFNNNLSTCKKKNIENTECVVCTTGSSEGGTAVSCNWK